MALAATRLHKRHTKDACVMTAIIFVASILQNTYYANVYETHHVATKCVNITPVSYLREV
jgi:hypothetical protein